MMDATLAAALSAKALALISALTPMSPNALLKVSRNLTKVTIDAMVATSTSTATMPAFMRLTVMARAKRRESTIARHDKVVKSDATIYATATNVDTAA